MIARQFQAVLARKNSAAGPTLLFADTFTDTNGTAIALHTPDTDVNGGGWQDASSDYKIDTNRLGVIFGASVYPAGVDLGMPMGQMSFDLIDPGGARRNWFYFRSDSAAGVPDNAFYVEASNFENTLKLFERTAGVDVERASTSVAFTTSGTFAIDVIDSGTSISGSVDGDEKWTYSSTAKASNTAIGVRPQQANLAYVDNLTVYGR